MSSCFFPDCDHNDSLVSVNAYYYWFKGILFFWLFISFSVCFAVSPQSFCSLEHLRLSLNASITQILRYFLNKVICLSVCLLSVYLDIFFVYLFVCPSFICLFINLSVYISYLFFCLSVSFISVYQCLSIYKSICLYQFVCLYRCISIN